jgi:hypothetical protein
VEAQLSSSLHRGNSNEASHTAAEAAYVILGLGQTSPIYNDLDEIFQSPYAEKISGLFDGQHTWQDVIANLSTALDKLFQPDFTDRLQNDPQAPLTEALRANRVDQWGPKTPVNLYHGSADIEVPFVISQLAYRNLRMNGGVNVQLIDLGKDVTHEKGYPLAMGQAALWFETF